MNRKNLLTVCKAMARNGIWCIPEGTLSAAFGYPAQPSLRVAMSRHVKCGIIDRISPGLYQNPFCQPSEYAIHRLANFLRPDDNFYLSLESVLSESSLISHTPSCTTFVTSGPSYVFETTLGVIQFVHTKESPDSWNEHLTYIPQRQVWQASDEKALADFRRYGNNLHMLNKVDGRG
jgi:predicted transcriptional regulator of viral defense system